MLGKQSLVKVITRQIVARKSLPLVIGITVLSTNVNAQGLRVSDGSATELSALSSGEQIVMESRDGAIQFAGHEINLSGFSGIAGYASDVAYLVTITGTAETGGTSAKRGRMFLIPPFGAEPTVERFDAGRLRNAWDDDVKATAPQVYASLDDLAKGQATGVLVGRLGRTGVNVNALGSAKMETARRETIGGAAVQQIRFSPDQANGDLERNIVTRFVSALAAGDEETAAQLLDPLPFGYDGLGDNGGAARLLTARALINERDWEKFSNIAPNKINETRWILETDRDQAVIDLRRTTDFAFIQAIEVGQ